MTAEIAILNKHGVALAADSKVTIGSVGQEKTYDTVNKLFTLSKVHPVGLMIFGNAEFMRYPWETIVKLYRQQKRSESEKTIARWGLDFLKFLAKFGSIGASDRSLNIQSILGSSFDELQDEAFADARRRSISIPSQEYVALLSKNLQQEIIRLQRLEDYFNDKQKKAFIAKYATDVGNVVNAHFEAFSDNSLVAKALELALLVVFKTEYSPQSSGFVIAGFGANEYFPSLVTYETDGYVGNVLKLTEGPSTEIKRGMASSIRPFAQKEMVQRFMNGIDPNITDALPRMIMPTIIQSCFDVLQKYGDSAKQTEESKQQIREAAKAAIDALGKTLVDVQRRHFSIPIMQMVSLLPKDELPHLAESLVALTSLKRHVSRDAETVGGPIDVCLISKVDGFIWIKRKHYFKPELNPQFVHNYMRDIDSTTGAGHEGQGTSKPTRSTRRRNKKTT